jgi:hypothetical protein
MPVRLADGSAREKRQLKHRAEGDSRIAPIHPELTKLLRDHLARFDIAPDGRLFGGVRGGELPTITYRRAWTKARHAVLTEAEQASPLARRPYDLRHACLSTWLNGGVYPTQVAEWAGHSVDVLLRIYAKMRSGPRRARQAQDQRSAAPGLMRMPSPLLILVLGTYWAQRPAFRRPRLHTTAYKTERQDHEGRTFLQFTGHNLRFQRVGLCCLG